MVSCKSLAFSVIPLGSRTRHEEACFFDTVPVNVKVAQEIVDFCEIELTHYKRHLLYCQENNNCKNHIIIKNRGSITLIAKYLLIRVITFISSRL